MANLDSLPAELLNNVGEYLIRDDVLALRLTSKDVSHKCRHSYAKLFKEVKVMISHLSLDLLEYMMQDQAIVPKVENIIIGTEHLEQHQDLTHLCSLGKSAAACYNATYEGLLRKDVGPQAEKYAHKVLCSSLDKFPRLKAITIEDQPVKSTTKPSYQSYGHSKIKKLTDLNIALSDPRGPIPFLRAFDLLSTVLVGSEKNVQIQLRICGLTEDSHEFRVSNPYIPFKSCKQMVNLLQKNIRHLELQAGSWCADNSVLWDMLHLVAGSQLESLCLRYIDLQPALVSLPGRGLPGPDLRSLHLCFPCLRPRVFICPGRAIMDRHGHSFGHTSVEDLSRFLRNNSSTLKSVTLRDLGYVSHYGWSIALMTLCELPLLEMLVLKKLHANMIQPRQASCLAIQWNGHDAISRGLRALVDYIRDNMMNSMPRTLYPEDSEIIDLSHANEAFWDT